jgi:hypothetical protein
MRLRGSYQNGFAPRDDESAYPSLWKGCVGAWCPSLGPTGNRLFDWSPLKNHGTLTGYTLSSAWTIKPDGRGNGYTLTQPGSAAHVVIPDSDAWDFGTGDFSISFWMIQNSLAGSHQGIISGDSSGDPSVGWSIYTLVDGQIHVSVNEASTNVVTSGTRHIDIATWNHIVLRREGTGSTGLNVWINGLAGSSPQTGNVTINSANTGLTFGRYYSNVDSFYLAGYLDDIRVYNRALTSQEIWQLYSQRGVAYQMRPPRFGPKGRGSATGGSVFFNPVITAA